MRKFIGRDFIAHDDGEKIRVFSKVPDPRGPIAEFRYDDDGWDEACWYADMRRPEEE